MALSASLRFIIETGKSRITSFGNLIFGLENDECAHVLQNRARFAIMSPKIRVSYSAEILM